MTAEETVRHCKQGSSGLLVIDEELGEVDDDDDGLEDEGGLKMSRMFEPIVLCECECECEWVSG